MSQLEPGRSDLQQALRTLHERPGDGTECPQAATLWDSAAGRLGPEAERDVVEHLSRCPACGQAWELARALLEDEGRGFGPATVRRGRLRSALWPLAASAALLIAAVGAWIVQRDPAPEGPPAYRETAGSWLVSKVDEDVPLPREACVLRWGEGPEGTTYDLLVLDERMATLVRAWDLQQPAHRVDPDALDSVPSGGKILWQVTAHLPDDREVTSVTFVHELE
jgi:hypothetical protein